MFVSSALEIQAQKLTFVPQWTPQSQFAGYYLALEKGFYAEEGLDVEIIHTGINSTKTPQDLLLDGTAQLAGMQLIQAAVARADGAPVVNVMQLTQRSGLSCVSRTPISKPEDLDGLKVGRWKGGYSEFCDIMECYKGIKVNWIPFINGINLYIFGAVDATLCYNYSELIALKLAVGDIPEDHIISFADFGYNCPEDGLYTTDACYASEKPAIDKFVKASKRGWDYVREHKEEALDIVMAYCEKNHIVTNRAHQMLMLDAYLSLQVNPQTGKADYSPVPRHIFGEMEEALLNTGYITRNVNYNEIIK